MTSAPEYQEFVTIDVARVSSQDQSKELTGTVEEFSEKNLLLNTEEEIPASAELIIRSRNRLFFGRVLGSHCQNTSDWKIAVRIRRSFSLA